MKHDIIEYIPTREAIEALLNDPDSVAKACITQLTLEAAHKSLRQGMDRIIREAESEASAEIDVTMGRMITEYRAEIGALANEGDDETAHLKEDEILWVYVKHQAAKGCALAQELLLLQDLDFERWCS